MCAMNFLGVLCANSCYGEDVNLSGKKEIIFQLEKSEASTFWKDFIGDV